MNTTELLALFRTEVFDLELPYLWSDEWVYGAIDASQKQFCRDTNGIADSRSFSITIVPGTEWYAIDPKILKLRDAVDHATGRDMPIFSIEKMAENGMKFDLKTGPIQALIAGMDEGMLRAWPVPSEPTVIDLRAFRLPLTVEAGDDLEIPEQHHRYILYWAKYLAYSVHDAEAYDKNAAEKYLTLHAAYCAKARIEQNRVRRPVSTVTYGGI